MTPLEAFNNQPEADAVIALKACCGSERWASELSAARPYDSSEALIEVASKLWFTLGEADWLAAFACHPRIGETKSPTTDFLTHSTGEQADAQRTIAAVAEQLAQGNRLYEQRFGFLYIVFASGRTAPELLAVLNERLTHTRAEELHEAAVQQDRITRLRMERWLTA